jgi:hypothetical protein
MQVNPAAVVASPLGKGAEYQPSFMDYLFLAFFRSNMVEVSSTPSIDSFLPSSS